MIKIKTELNQFITFVEENEMLVAKMRLEVEPIEQSWYREMVDIMKVLKLNDIPISVREILTDKLEDHKDSLIRELTSYCEDHITSYAEIVEE